jgi:hypothetical protein
VNFKLCFYNRKYAVLINFNLNDAGPVMSMKLEIERTVRVKKKINKITFGRLMMVHGKMILFTM